MKKTALAIAAWLLLGAWMLPAVVAGKGGSISGGGAGPSATFTSSRTSCVAPCSVFFDATATTDTGVTSNPFHDLYYTWDFDDVSAGTWLYGANTTISPLDDKNYATGGVAAHVFETAGTYTVTMTVCDANLDCNVDTDDVTVSDPDTVFSGTNTICVSTSGIFTGCPSGATQRTSSDFDAELATYLGTTKRILFRRGESFSASTSTRINADGPGIVGAFGTGAAPVVTMDGNTQFILISSASTNTIDDWRIMDLEFDGLSKSSAIGINTDGQMDNLTILRMNIHDVITGISAGGSILHYYATNGYPNIRVHNGWYIGDSTIVQTGTGYTGADWRIFIVGYDLAIVGNNLDNNNSSGSHVIRVTFSVYNVIAHNTISNAGSGAMNLKLHAPLFGASAPTIPGGVGIPTQYISISDNKIVGGTASAWLSSIGPQDDTQDERVRDVVMERNWYVSGSATATHLHENGSDVTVRNNLFQMQNDTGIDVDRWNSSPEIPDNVRIYNNTFYNGTATASTSITIDSAATNIAVQNNLGYAPSSSSVMLSGTGTSPGPQTNNTTDTSTNPSFDNISSPPAGARIGTGSYAVNAGTIVYPASKYDFFNCHEAGSNVRAGAFIPSTNAVCP